LTVEVIGGILPGGVSVRLNFLIELRMPPAIAVDDLSRTFIKRRSLRDTFLRPWVRAERVTALEGVTFRVEQGEIFGLLGPNGAGKTTLLKILSCLIIQTRGGAVVNGFDTLRQEMRVSSVATQTSDSASHRLVRSYTCWRRGLPERVARGLPGNRLEA